MNPMFVSAQIVSFAVASLVIASPVVSQRTVTTVPSGTAGPDRGVDQLGPVCG